MVGSHVAKNAKRQVILSLFAFSQSSFYNFLCSTHMPRTRNEGHSSAYWCFTINNPNETDYSQLDFGSWNCVKEAVYNLEMGEEGTPHLQGYIGLTRHKTLAWMKRKITRAHLEKRKGTREQAILYCLKDCGRRDICYDKLLDYRRELLMADPRIAQRLSSIIRLSIKLGRIEEIVPVSFN